MIRRPPRSTLDRSSAASDVYKRQGHANTLFPNTTIDNPFDTSRAVEIGLKLLKDKDYYKDVIEIAKEKLSWFSIEKTLKRLDMMLKGNNEN